MKLPELATGRGVLIALLLTVTVVSTASLMQNRQLPFEPARTGARVVIGRLTPGSLATDAGLCSGDVIRAMDGRSIGHLAEALWLTRWVQAGDSIHLTLARNDSVFTATIFADQPISRLYLILDRITALAFLILGLLVGWRSQGDATASAFKRLNLVLGVTVMLSDFPSSLPGGVAQIAYMIAYLGTRSFIPAALLDFVFRFASLRAPGRQQRLTLILYTTATLACILSVITGLGAALESTPQWLLAFDIANRYVYGISLIVATLVALSILLAAAWTARTPWEHKQYRWLLLCLVVGAAPYVFFVKLPTLLGQSSPISVGVAMAMLLITPLGWGMAVTSFRMLRVEWTLSRTIVHLISVGILVYLGASIVLLGGEISRAGSWFSLLTLGVASVLLLVLSFRTLLERVKWAVDHVYYGDWFDVAQVMHNLELRLSTVRREADIAKILTEDLSAILKVRESLLLIRSSGRVARDGTSEWYPASHRPGVAANATWTTVLSVNAPPALPYIPDSAEPLAKLGYRMAVPLSHGKETLGWLLLGGKVSGAPYSERDYGLLRALSPVAGMALVGMEMNSRLLDHERRLVVIDLAGGIAHEIGNALSPLMGQAQLIEHALRRDPERITKESVAQPLQIIVDMCGRIRRIVQNLSRLSQPVQLQPAPVCLNDVAEDAIQLMSETAGRIKRFHVLASTHTRSDDDLEESPYRLRKEYGADIPLVLGDAQQLSQVFINLIINAADAMESDGRGLLTVGTMASMNPSGVVGFVEDTGPGIPPEAMEKIFEPYFTTKPKGQGTGLGLTFIRSIIEAHHGHIRVRPAENHGARFEFFLPALSAGGSESTSAHDRASPSP